MSGNIDGGPRGSRAKILIVDDTEANRTAFQAVLCELGDVVVASSGPEALHHLLEAEFAGILLDICMPVMDGIETATLIRKRASSWHTPIIFVSAYEKTPLEVAKGGFSGPIDYLFCPVDAAVLKRKVADLVDLHRRNTETRRQLEAALSANRDLEARIRELEARIR